MFDRSTSVRRKSARRIGRGVDRAQPGAASAVGRAQPDGGRAQLASDAGRSGQSFAVGNRSVASKQLVEGNTWCKVLQHEEPGSHVGGNDARGQTDPDIVTEELERCQLAAQPPLGSSGLIPAGRDPFDDDGSRCGRSP
ncbi:hypothetical protein [Streptomyces sp. LN785]|uniref:hypothetical protein n=1 Tax=Streptomyces sp. LN785 TaxID=3112983 RepID=UPI0037120C70